MYNGGDAAEQIVRLSLEGFQVAAKITGEAAKNIALLLISVLRQEKKTKGKTRLTNMIKSGKELKVFSVERKDLSKFLNQAKKYGVLYTVLRDKNNKDEHSVVDIIARAEDASKIQRIMDRFDLACVDRASIVTQAEKDIADRKYKSKDNSETEKYDDKDFFDDVFADDEPDTEKSQKEPEQNADEEVKDDENPFTERTENPLSEQNSTDKTQLSDKGTADENKKPSVKAKLKKLKAEFNKQKSDKSKILDVANGEHQIPKPKINKSKER